MTLPRLAPQLVPSEASIRTELQTMLAIACSLAGRNLSAKNKRADRRRLLVQAGISSEALPTIDDIDAALCALSAQHVLAGRFKAYGDAAEGFILLPGR